MKKKSMNGVCLYRYVLRKAFFAMKLTLLIFLLTTFSLIAGESYSQDTRISLNMRDVQIKDVLLKIESNSEYFFIYNNQLVDVDRKVSISADNQKISDVLHTIFQDQQIDFQVTDRKIVITPVQSSMAQQQKSVSGKVIDNTGAGLPGVSVVVKGTTSGTITDFDGNYSLANVPANATLQFSFVGMKSQEVQISGKTTIDIVLQDETVGIEEVVAIGYGKQSRAKVVGAVSKINDEELTKIAAPSIDQQIGGKMAGVVINQANGQPGAGSQIVIRGTGTLTAGTNPLIVVDGFPLSEGSSLNSINPNDIEDIDVLKDAASAAIYGSRAANGVILVTTKKGKSDQKPSVTFETYHGFQKQSSGVELVDAYQFAKYITEARNWGYVSKDPSNRSESDPNSVRVTKKIGGKSIDGRELFLDFLQPYLDGTPGLVNTNWMDEAFRTAPIDNYALSVSGGGNKSKYYLSVGYFNQEGVVIGTQLKRYSAAFSVESELSKKIKVGVNIKPSFTDQNGAEQSNRSSGTLGLLPLSFPYYSPYLEDGSLNISEQVIKEQRVIEGVAINGTPVENLVATAKGVKDKNERFRSFGNVYLNAELIKNLNYNLSVGGDYDAYSRDYFYPSSIGAYRVPAPRSDADSQQDKDTRYNYIVENTLNYTFGFNKHSFTALAGHTYQKERDNLTNIVGTKFPDNNIQNVGGASSFTVVSSLNIWTLESYFSRLQYDFDSKYLLSLAIRSDGSSRFGNKNRWGNFPSLSAGWIFSREKFMGSGKVLTLGKLSTSWGQTGNNQIGTYGSMALVTNSNYVFGQTTVPGYITTTSPNPDLGWEIASSLNIGLDLGFFNKYSLSTAYYKTNTKDLLLNVPVPQQTGYTTVLANIGEMENQGLEFQLSGNNIKVGKLSIGFNANLTTFKNKVIALGPGQTEIATGTDQNFVTKVGHSIAEIYGYKITGIYKTQAEIDNTPHLAGTLTGDYIVEDVNGDKAINVKDKVSKGTFAPDFTYGFGANLSYKNVDFSFNFSGVGGRTLMDGDMSSLTEAGEGFAVPSKYYFEHRYHPVNNPDGFLGQPNYANFSNARKLVRSSSVVERNNGDYLRLRDIRLSYTFSKPTLEKLKLTGLQLYISGNNVFTMTKYRGWNPDGTSTNILTSGYNTGANYPLAKSYLIGLRITY